jgi:hypothetical protein
MKQEPITKLDISKKQDARPHEYCVTCEQSWSFAQMEAVKRLSIREKSLFSGKSKLTLVSDFSVRAARIAGNYARFYLETEPGGRPELKGRFYWMGLAAFASKQVMCGLDFTKFAQRASAPLVVMPATYAEVNAAILVGKNGLGKGNFWLFQDIFCWHWLYVKSPDEFMSCKSRRNVDTYETETQKRVKDLPWASAALGAINNLKKTNEIDEAFDLIKAVEAMPAGAARETAKFESLLKIADHEQLKILQPLIYDDWTFQKILDGQALSEGLPYVPLRSAAFAIACDVKDSEHRVQMTDDDGSLYKAKERMKFILAIAKQYHKLMQIETRRMESTIATIASWADKT